MSQRIMSFCLLIVGAFIAVLAPTEQANTKPNDPGPALFPYLISGFLVFFAVVMLWLSIRPDDTANDVQVAEASVDRTDWLRALAVLGLLVGYVVLFDVAGFLLSTTGFLASCFILLAPASQRDPITNTLSAVAAALTLKLLFTRMLGITLPVLL